jgi:hypothetical protein
LGQLSQLLCVLRFQLLNAGLRRIKRHAQTHGPLHQQIRGVGLRPERIADQTVCRGVFGVGARLAQSVQKLLQLVTFSGVHRETFQTWMGHYGQTQRPTDPGVQIQRRNDRQLQKTEDPKRGVGPAFLPGAEWPVA